MKLRTSVRLFYVVLFASLALTVAMAQQPQAPEALPTTQVFDPVPPPTYFPETVALQKRVDALEARIKVMEKHAFEMDERASAIEGRAKALEARPNWTACSARFVGVPGVASCDLVQ